MKKNKIYEKIKNKIRLKLGYGVIEDRDSLNNKYRSGLWNGLDEIDEMGRFAIIGGLIKKKFSGNLNILELGCGRGSLLDYIYSEELNYLGIDLSNVAINYAKEKYKYSNINFLEDDFNNINSSINNFDCIVFNESLYYANNIESILFNYNGLLKKNGYIIVSLFDNIPLIMPKSFKVDNYFRITNNKKKSWSILIGRINSNAE